MLTTPGASEIAKLDPGATGKDGKLTPEAERTAKALEQLTSTETEAERQGKGEAVILVDKGPAPVKPLPPGLSVPVGQVVARLLAQADATASGVLDQLREQAFAGGVLKKEFPDICAGMTAELKPAIDTELHDIAAAAGVSADQLAGLVTARQAELDASTARLPRLPRRPATGDRTGCRRRPEDDGRGGRRRRCRRRGNASAAGGGGRHRRPDGDRRPARPHLGWIKEHVTTQTTNYQKAGEERSRELTTAQRQQTDAYKALVQREQFKILVPQPARPPRDVADKPREAELADAATAVRAGATPGRCGRGDHPSVARRRRQGGHPNRKSIESAGTAAIEAANVWAEGQGSRRPELVGAL